MKVKKLREELEFTDDEDEIVVSYFDFGTGGMRDTTDVTIATVKSKLIFIADPD